MGSGQALAAAVPDPVIGLQLNSATNAQMKTTKQICQWPLKLSQWILLDSLVRSATRSLTARVFVNHALRLSGQALVAAVQARVIGLKLTSATNAQMKTTKQICLWLLKLSQWILQDSLVRSATRSLTARVLVHHALRLSGQALAVAVQDRVIGLKLTSATNAQMNPTIFWCKRDIETNGYCSFRGGMSEHLRLLFRVC